MQQLTKYLASRARVLLVLTLVLAGAIARHGHAETWADRLGFPPGAKVLILHAHEMGMCHETIEATANLLADTAVQSASAMPPAPWFADAAKWSEEHRDADIGLDLTINSEWPRYRWRPISADALTSTLVDADGYFWRSVQQTMVSASAQEVEKEIRTQIAHARLLGLRPTHLTTHLGALFARADLAEVYLRVARDHWIPAVAIELTPELIERFRGMGYPVPDELIHAMDGYPLPTINDLRIIPTTDSLAAKAAAVVDAIETAPAGITQIAFLPATDSPALRAIDPHWQQRVWEAEVWRDESVRAALEADGVVVTDWRELMQRYEGRPGR